jgi:predicted DNA-binding transcriptional regulator AlpA
MTDVTARPFEPLLTVEDLEQMLRIDRRTVARLCKRGLLPQPLKLGGGNRWRAEDVTSALESLAANRKGQKREGKWWRVKQENTNARRANPGVA